MEPRHFTQIHQVSLDISAKHYTFVIIFHVLWWSAVCPAVVCGAVCGGMEFSDLPRHQQ